ncbi:MAG: ABC transporter substrate-binding protein [Hyphomicrobiales bacterium]|nr:ABC transporter substrate-binding protein [Hyphomicrobiales bacterium]
MLIRLFAAVSIFAAFFPSIAFAAPGDDSRINIVRLAARGGQVIGAASGCKEIAPLRIQAIKARVTELIEGSSAKKEDATFLLEMFESSLAGGQRAVAAGQVMCDAAERDLAALEKSTPMGQPAGATAARSSQETVTAAVPPSQVVRGVNEKEIRFGISAPFTGPARELGNQMKIGIETAFAATNEAGGVNGRMLRLIAADDGYEPTRTAETMKQLYEKDQVFGVVGNVGTPTAAVAIPYALERKMLFFGGFTGANILRRDPPDRYVFNYRASYAEETEAVVNYLVKIRRLKPDQIAVFAQQDSFGDSGFSGVSKAIRNLRGGEAATVVRLNYKRNTLDVDEAVNQLKTLPNIRAIVMVATYRAAAKFIEKTRLQYPQMIYTNVSFVGSTALADELMLLGPRYAKGVIVTQVVPAVNDYSSVILEYKTALNKHFPGVAPDYVSLEGYISAKVLIEGLRRAGPQLDVERVVEALESMRDYDMGLGAPISFTRSKHQGVNKVWGTQLTEEGKYESIELE